MVMSKNMFFLLAAVLTSTFLPLNAQSDSARSQLEALVHSIEANDIVSVEIFGVPEDAVFAVNISPESLKNAWDYKVTLRLPGASVARSGIDDRSASSRRATGREESGVP